MNRFYRTALIAMAAGMIAGAAQAATNDFDDAGDTTGATVDRYAPAVFQSGVSFAGHAGTLEEATSVSDGANNRPAAYSSSFYNTQGKAFPLSPSNYMSVQLYAPTNWTDAADARHAGFWGVGRDAANNVSAYGIIELAKIGGVDTWRVWDNTDWVNLGASTTGWTTLSMKLLSGTNQIKYTVGGYSALVGANGTTNFDSAIFQVHNTAEGVVDTAHWDNLNVAAVPEPATWAMMIGGFGFVGASLRSRKRAAVLA